MTIAPLILTLLLAAPTTPTTTAPTTSPSSRPTTRPATRPAPMPAKPAQPKPPAPKPPSSLPPPPDMKKPVLWEQVAQRRDRALRVQTLAKLQAMLAGENVGDQLDALRTLSQVTQIKFDRTPFGPLIRQQLHSTSPDVRAAALGVLPSYDISQLDLASIAALAEDPSPRVRANVPAALVAANGRVGSAELDAAMLRLLDDTDKSVRRDAMRAINNVDVSVAVEAKLLVMSRDAEWSREAANCLAGRPFLRRNVVERFIELLDVADPLIDQNRVANALRNPVDDSIKPALQSTLFRTIDDSLSSSVRENCVIALGQINTPEVASKLEAIAADPDEEDRLRDVATRVLRDGR